MKKLLLLFLCTVYLFSISEVRIAVHYCHGHFQKITFNSDPNEDACCKKGKRPMKKHGCCDDKVITAKIKTEQRVNTPGVFSFTSGTAVADLPLIENHKTLHFADNTGFSPSAHAPPDPGAVPDRIMNCTFRI
jgi:hypothetical protein